MVAIGQIGPPNPPAGEAQALEGLRRGHLVDEVEIDVEQRGLAGLLAHDVALPDTVEERLAHSCMQSTGAASRR